MLSRREFFWMGMHHGLIMFRGDITALSEVLAERNGTLDGFGEAISLDLLPSTGDNGFPCAFRRLVNATVFLDGSMMLGGDVDLIAALARRTGALAAGCVGETVSGTFEFVAADAQRVRRAYTHCHAAQIEPWTFGEPLQCEGSHQFNSDPDGTAFFAAFAELGFGDLRQEYEAAWTPCVFDMNWDVSEPTRSALSVDREAFVKSKALDRTPPLVVVAKQHPAAPSKSTDRREKPGVWQRLRGLLGG